MKLSDLQNQNMYCCNPTPCYSLYEYVHCPNGNFQSLPGLCNMTCPIAKTTSSIALSTYNCSDKGHCFDAKDKHHLFNKVCLQTVNISEDNFTRYCGTRNAEICNKNVTTKNEFSQCIVTASTSL